MWNVATSSTSSKTSSFSTMQPTKKAQSEFLNIRFVKKETRTSNLMFSKVVLNRYLVMRKERVY